MHDPGDLHQHRVLQLVSLQEALEAAVAPVVGQLDTGHVEGGGVRGHLARVPHEHELRCRIDIAEDEPGAGRPVDVAAPAGRPPHGTTSAARASSATAPTACSRAWIGK